MVDGRGAQSHSRCSDSPDHCAVAGYAFGCRAGRSIFGGLCGYLCDDSARYFRQFYSGAVGNVQYRFDGDKITGSGVYTGIRAGCWCGIAVFFTPSTLAIASISSADDGIADRIPVRLSGCGMALEARAGVGGKQSRSVKAGSADPGLTDGFSGIHRTGASTVALRRVDVAGVWTGLVDPCTLGEYPVEVNLKLRNACAS